MHSAAAPYTPELIPAPVSLALSKSFQDAEMFAFLKELRLGHYAHYFESNGISIGLLKVMSDKERADVLRSIGVRAVGARVAINHAFMDMDR